MGTVQFLSAQTSMHTGARRLLMPLELNPNVISVAGHIKNSGSGGMNITSMRIANSARGATMRAKLPGVLNPFFHFSIVSRICWDDLKYTRQIAGSLGRATPLTPWIDSEYLILFGIFFFASYSFA